MLLGAATVSKNMLEWMIFITVEYWPLLMKGVKTTLLISITGTIIGLIIGLLVAIIKTIPSQRNESIVKRIFKWITNFLLAAYVEVFRGTPMIVQAMIFYFGGHSIGIKWEPFAAGLFVVSINTGAYMAEIARSGIISIDQGQFEGAASIGMSHYQTMFSVVLPQAIRNIMPAIGNEFVVNIKDTSVLNIISVSEVFFQGKAAAGLYAQPIPAYLVIAVIYFILTFTVTRILLLIEKKMDGPSNFKVIGSQTTVHATHGSTRKAGH